MDNKGFEVEVRFKKFFKGYSSPFDAVDFETSNCLYEVKSCALFVRTVNGNNKRKFGKVPHKPIASTQHGRFFVIVENHYSLKSLADRYSKKAKYIFAVYYGKQLIWKVMDWFDVKICSDKYYHTFRIKDIFGDKL